MSALATAYGRRQFLRFTRTERWPMLERHPVAESVHRDLLAGMLGIPWEQVAAELDGLRAETARAAADLVGEARLRASVENLPFTADDRVVAIGDSITADRLGWFEMLIAASAAVGRDGPSLLNLGLSGNTTADVLERFDLLEAARPTRVLLMLGTNDARRHGRPTGHQMATTAETERNLRVLAELIGGLGAEVTFLTPPPIDAGSAGTFFASHPLDWDVAAVAEVAAVVRKIDAGCVDLYSAMESCDLPGLLESDGVHPTVAGQRFILTTILDRLSH